MSTFIFAGISSQYWSHNMELISCSTQPGIKRIQAVGKGPQAKQEKKLVKLTSSADISAPHLYNFSKIFFPFFENRFVAGTISGSGQLCEESDSVECWSSSHDSFLKWIAESRGTGISRSAQHPQCLRLASCEDLHCLGPIPSDQYPYILTIPTIIRWTCPGWRVPTAQTVSRTGIKQTTNPILWIIKMPTSTTVKSWVNSNLLLISFYGSFTTCFPSWM